MSNTIQPHWSDGIPRCASDCPSFDGKRCELLGHQPDGICEPAVGQMVEAIKLTLHNLDYLSNLWGAEGVTRSVQDRLRKSIGQ